MTRKVEAFGDGSSPRPTPKSTRNKVTMGAGRGLGEDGLKPGYKVTKHIGTDRLHGQCLPEPVLSCLSCRNKKDTRRRHVTS